MSRILNNVIRYPALHSAQAEITSFVKVLRFVVIRCGRRFGKTTLFEVLAAAWAVRGYKVGWFSPNYKLLSPSYKRILRLVRPMVISASKIDGLIELEGGGSIEFWTLNDEDAGRSRAYHRVLIDEAGLVMKRLREIWEQAIYPTLLDYGGSAVMGGTPKGVSDESYFYLACTDKELGWTEYHAPTAANPNLDAESVANLIHELPPLVYQQEILAEFIDWSGAAFFSQDSLLVDGKPVDMPLYVDAVYAVIDTAVKGGREHDGVATTYFSLTHRDSKASMHILDWDIAQIEGSLLEAWIPQVYARLAQLAGATKSIHGSLGTFIEDKAAGSILINQAVRKGFAAQAIDSKLTSYGKDERGISVSGYVFQGMIKVTRPAFEKVVTYKGVTKNHCMSQVCGYRVGVEDQQDDLYDTFCYGVSIGLGNSKGF